MKTELFDIPGALRIERIRPREGPSPVFNAWKPGTSQAFTDRKKLLKFCAWPKSTPTGQRLREWLDSLDLAKPDLANPQEVIAQSWGPEAHEEDPTANTKMVV